VYSMQVALMKFAALWKAALVKLIIDAQAQEWLMKELANIQDTSKRITLGLGDKLERFKHNLELLADSESVSFGSVFEKLNRFDFLLKQLDTTSNLILIAQIYREASELALQIKNEGELISKSYRDSSLPEEGVRISSLLSCYSVFFHGYSLIIGFEDEKEFEVNTKDKNTIEIDLVDWAEGVELIAQSVDDYQYIFTSEVQDFLKGLANFLLGYIHGIEFKNVNTTKEEDEVSFNKTKKKIQYAARSILWVLEHFRDESPNPSREEEEPREMLHEFPSEALKQTNFSYKQVYEEAKNAVKTDDKEELIATLRSWREEFTNELEKLSGN